MQKVMNHPTFSLDEEDDEEEDEIFDLTKSGPEKSINPDQPVVLVEATFSPVWWFFRPELAAAFIVFPKLNAFAEMDLLVSDDKREVKIGVVLSVPPQGIDQIATRTNLANSIIRHVCKKQEQYFRIRFNVPVDDAGRLSHDQDRLSIVQIQLPTKHIPIKLT